MKIYAVTTKPMENMGGWFTALQPGQKNDMLEPDKGAGPQGAGYIVTLKGIHYVDTPDRDFISKSLIAKLNEWEIPFTTASGVQEMIPIRRMGISHPALLYQTATTITYAPYVSNRPITAPGQTAPPPVVTQVVPGQINQLKTIQEQTERPQSAGSQRRREVHRGFNGAASNQTVPV